MTMRPIYLIAPSGNPNFGDEFIAASWLKHLAKAHPETEVYLDCPEPGIAQSLFAELHPKLRVTDTLWRAVRDAAAFPTAEMSTHVADLVKNLGSPRYDLGLLQLRQAGSLHLLGGGYVNSLWPQHYGLIAGMQAVRELTGARLLATGLGLMPFLDDGTTAADSLFHKFDYASARDAESTSAFGMTQGIDDAFLGAPAEIGRNSLAANSLCVCIQSDTVDDGYFDKAVAFAREHIQKAVDAGKSVYYFEAIPGVDRAAFDQLEDLIPEANFIPFSVIWANGLPLSPNQEWLTTRFHFHLLAAAAGATGTVIGAKAGYYDIKHKSVQDLGSGWSHVSVGGEASAPAANTLNQNLDSLVERKLAEANMLYPVPSWAEGSSTLGQSLLRSVKRRISS
ncbi:polysaccharide pyruvyl transferase family protein [Arthrobacter sp. H35-D1]|uniref:polysaccharide pyruvyl transferase family protein n=1 Tax=Arthrobacter sp. H35-D1 TaxID=3046202 RepID=UPI0024B97EE6|nr:polysaccharide pyruvyl transferase family protein [Arthrobacter sp. H35-D1]MDJ0312987.1 polysaccharide pyruvyl transferase family protein [Arthrobacter sp. H35-D1]